MEKCVYLGKNTRLVFKLSKDGLLNILFCFGRLLICYFFSFSK